MVVCCQGQSDRNQTSPPCDVPPITGPTHIGLDHAPFPRSPHCLSLNLTVVITIYRGKRLPCVLLNCPFLCYIQPEVQSQYISDGTQSGLSQSYSLACIPNTKRYSNILQLLWVNILSLDSCQPFILPSHAEVTSFVSLVTDYSCQPAFPCLTHMDYHCTKHHYIVS